MGTGSALNQFGPTTLLTIGRREPFPDSGDGDSELESAAVGGQEVPGVEEVAHVRHQRTALSRHALRTSGKKHVKIRY